ncbi:hypothetical protein JXA48_03150 [Candidatus Woesearchaeota archaeon]|nr:hypothetical protein [Candidatus Woesearchaeota archaeon]
MKRILLSLLLVLVLALSACSLTGFAPWQQTSSNGTVLNLNDTFEFVDVPVDDENVSVNVSTNITEDEPIEAEQGSDGESLILTTVEVTEGDLVSLADLLAEDPDGDSVDYIYSEPFNSRGLWQTNDGDAGKYLVDITATDGLLSTTEQVRVVVKPSNKGPVVDCPSSYAVYEGELIDLPCVIYDREGDKVTYAVTGFMSDLKYQTTYDDAGEYVAIVTATDGQKTTVKEISILVAEKNRKPVVDEMGLIEVVEGEVVSLTVDATDPDGDALTIEYPEKFSDDGKWVTARGDAGTYEFEVGVSDGIDTVFVSVEVVVEKVNVAPIINSIDTIEVNEGETIVLPIKVLDEDGDDVSIKISGFMTSDTYKTTYDDAGTHKVTVEASDGKHTVSTDVNIIVHDVNRPPVFIVK